MQLDHGTHVYQQQQLWQSVPGRVSVSDILKTHKYIYIPHTTAWPQLPQKKQKNRQVKYRSNSVDLHLVRIFLELKLW